MVLAQRKPPIGSKRNWNIMLRIDGTPRRVWCSRRIRYRRERLGADRNDKFDRSMFHDCCLDCCDCCAVLMFRVFQPFVLTNEDV